ncbi:hypothetical protein PAAG_07641 [Paracoccidioides lutzii Pb01]|uniref:Uncharacterized protein n=1 Tax=Paracoccidioides lutzii (strain ATCC MYA-826 / Pb01) TaxID=502779 RepID=C1HAI7_PARBA|nr:hypothetical protein PAAG_07641 [Paracoccidioides lutzii Pb01]EEH37360.2 hypothetical protein PAAG_07641 [Paracoccidioides lutzii Pb01]
MSSTATTQRSGSPRETSSSPVRYHPVPSSQNDGSFSSVAIISSEPKSDSPAGPGQLDESPRGYLLRRFYLRSVLLVLVPPAITAYFCVIEWAVITKNAESNRYGHRIALWVYYSWFIIGVFGLGISKFGLAGVEAVMLQDRHWQVNDAMLQRRNPEQVSRRGRLMLQASTLPVIPGAGVVYTPQYLDRSQYSYLVSFPNSLPLDEQAPELFLAPQGEYPVAGRTWGLRLGYNCSVVTSESEFTVVGRKPELNSEGSQTFNLLAYMEVGVRKVTSYSTDQGQKERFSHDKKLNDVDIFEYAFWQIRTKATYENERPVNFNNTIASPFSGLGGPLIKLDNGSYQVNTTFFEEGQDRLFNQRRYFNLTTEQLLDIIEPAPPIGVRCRFVSQPGVATLDPYHSTFHSFIHTLPKPLAHKGSEYRADPFGRTISDMLFSATYGATSAKYETYEQLFESTNSPPPEAYSNASRYLGFLQPHIVLQAIMRAFGTEALQLMYDGIKGFEQACVVLGVVYGFRRRWAETLDGYSFFRFGADRVEDIKGRPDLVGCNKELDQSEGLKEIPGLIGDMRVGQPIGHIGLVARKNVADRSKLYM